MNTPSVSHPVEWLFLDFNSYFAACEQHDRPELRGRPIIVVPVMADTSCAIAASYEARAFGIKTGMLIRDAKARCPGLILVPARHDLYVALHHRLVELVEACLPVTAVLSIDELHCRLKGSETETKQAIAIANRIKNRISEQVGPVLTCSIGLGPNAYLAKVAAEMQKPNGLTVITRADLPDKLYSLALRDLPGIGPRMEARLHRHGIHDIQGLLSARREELRAVWGGVEGLRMAANLRGEAVERSRGPTRSISHQHVLEPAVRQWPRARFVVRQLLVRAAERMRGQGFLATRLALTVKPMGGESSYGYDIGFGQSDDTGYLLRRLDDLWGQASGGPARPLRIGVVLHGLIPQSLRQFDLFSDSLRSPRLSAAVDALNQKYGRHTVGFGLSPHDHEGRATRIAFSRIPDLYEF